MEDLVSKMNGTSRMPSGPDRNTARDSIFSEMVSLGQISSLSEHVDMGHILANIAILVTLDCDHISDERFRLILGLCVHESAYVTFKARDGVLKIICEKDIADQFKHLASNHVKQLVQASTTDQRLLRWVLNVVLACGEIQEGNFLGCLVGGAVGDAVALPVDGFQRDICQRYVREVVHPQLLSRYHRHNYTFGQYSADTQFTREMLLAVLQCRGKLDPTVYAVRLAMLFQPGAYRVVGYGKNMASAAEAIRNGAHYTESGCTTSSSSSVVLHPSIGLMLAGKPKDEIARVARVISGISHSSPGGMDAATAVALATYYAAVTHDLPFVGEHFIEFVAMGVSSDFAGCVREVWTMRSWSMEDAAARVVDIGVSKKERTWGLSISTEARQSALWALWSFLQAPNSFVDCVGYAIAIGGNVGTAAAAAGGICGARKGVNGVPQVWSGLLHDYGEWKYQDLMRVGMRIYGYVQRSEVTLGM